VTAHDGKFWLAGRQIKLRGINVIPNWNGTAPTDADFARIASWGMNFVRFQVRWSFVEPTAPIHQGNRWIHSYDGDYLADLQSMVTLASNHGLSVLIDNAGLPGPDPIDDWWPQWLYQAPYNSHQKDYTNRDEANTDYWTDSLQQQFTSDYLQYLAGGLAPYPGITGYEVLNEPASGNLPDTHETTQLLLGVSLALAQAVRAVDPPRVVYFMTRGSLDSGLPNADLSGFAALGNVALDVHDYFGARWGAGLLMDPDAAGYGEILENVDRFTLSAGPYLGTTTGQVRFVQNYTRFLDPLGIPLVVGEFTGDPTESNMNNLMGTMTAAFNDQGVSWTHFAYSGTYSILQPDGSLQPWAHIVIEAAQAP
jgi:hypothetical protein